MNIRSSQNPQHVSSVEQSTTSCHGDHLALFLVYKAKLGVLLVAASPSLTYLAPVQKFHCLPSEGGERNHHFTIQGGSKRVRHLPKVTARPDPRPHDLSHVSCGQLCKPQGAAQDGRCMCT